VCVFAFYLKFIWVFLLQLEPSVQQLFFFFISALQQLLLHYAWTLFLVSSLNCHFVSSILFPPSFFFFASLLVEKMTLPTPVRVWLVY
jgi:hypothetical protein